MKAIEILKRRNELVGQRILVKGLEGNLKLATIKAVKSILGDLR
jgi:hypothetical protein